MKCRHKKYLSNIALLIGLLTLLLCKNAFAQMHIQTTVELSYPRWSNGQPVVFFIRSGDNWGLS
jgi:hypothetical protein